MRISFLVALFVALVVASPAEAQRYFEIHVVDDATDAPVPCVTVRTVHNVALRTDRNGVVAFHEPGLVDMDVWFYVEGDHVMYAADGFGYHGHALRVTDGGSGELRVAVTGAPTCTDTDVESRRIARGVPLPAGYFRIDVIDDVTMRGVPLVELRLGSDVGLGDTRRWVTDSAGVIALDPLDLEGMQSPTIASHGYTFDAQAVTLDVRAGGHTTIRAHRENVAERMYRVTGGGIYRDSVLLGLDVPTASPVINGLVLGQDSDFSVVHRGELFWIWGDTLRPAYPLGNFHTSGATSVLPDVGGLDPEEGVDLTYFVDAAGFARAMAPTETVPGPGVTWLGSLVSVPDAMGVERLHATFGMYASLSERTRFGMLAYDEATHRFVDGVDFDGPDARYPDDNGFARTVDGATWIYFQNGIRIPARSEAMLDPGTYEAFTPLVGSTVQRDGSGAPMYAWRAGEANATAGEEGLTAREQLDTHLLDVATGTSFEAHGNGALDPNPYAGHYVRLITPRWRLGELWVALSDSPLGPWVHTQRVLRHAQYTYYNPRQHAALAREHGRRIYFDGTYTTSFSGNDDPTPRYDYNQIMYALDLDGPALTLPVPIYESARGELGTVRVVHAGDAPIAAAFFAHERAASGTVPVWWSGPSCEMRTLHVGGTPETPPIFWALPAGTTPLPHQTALYETWPEGGVPRYGVVASTGSRAIAVVWTSPISVALPIADTLIAPHPDAGVDRCLVRGPLVLTPAPTGMVWQIDGHTVSGSVPLEAGLTTVSLVATEDGVTRSDWMLVRVGDAPVVTMPPMIAASGCACRAGARARSSSGALFSLALAALVLVRRRSRSRARRTS